MNPEVEKLNEETSKWFLMTHRVIQGQFSSLIRGLLGIAEQGECEAKLITSEDEDELLAIDIGDGALYMEAFIPDHQSGQIHWIVRKPVSTPCPEEGTDDVDLVEIAVAPGFLLAFKDAMVSLLRLRADDVFCDEGMFQDWACDNPEEYKKTFKISNAVVHAARGKGLVDASEKDNKNKMTVMVSFDSDPRTPVEVDVQLLRADQNPQTYEPESEEYYELLKAFWPGEK